jgi:hypothetical protein
MNVQKVIYSEKGNPLLVINGAKFFKTSVMKDGKTRWRCREKFLEIINTLKCTCFAMSFS